jgi:hypothetical protein
MNNTRDFSGFFADEQWAAANGWVLTTKTFRQRHRFHPNLTFCHRGLREVMVPLHIKGSPERAATLSAPLIEHYCRLVQETMDGRLVGDDRVVRQVWVTLARDVDGTYLGTVPIRQIATAIVEAGARPNPPTRSDLPPYYWIDSNARVSTLKMFLDRVRDDDDDDMF